MTATMRAPDRRRRARKAAGEAVAEMANRLAIKMLTPDEIRFAMFGEPHHFMVASNGGRADALGGTI